MLEVFPGVLGIAALIALYNRFRFTTLVYTLIVFHCGILFIGGHYTYAEVPLFSWIRDHFHLARNDYDRVGHFAQGFVPYLIAREVAIRRGVFRSKGWRIFFSVGVCLAISALYELIEWQSAVLGGASANAFLGTQGDPWDTQEDMATALFAALIAEPVMGRLHDRALAAFARTNAPGTRVPNETTMNALEAAGGSGSSNDGSPGTRQPSPVMPETQIARLHSC
jgi:putative membrane protein